MSKTNSVKPRAKSASGKKPRRERVPLLPEMALEILSSVLGECQLAGIEVVAKADGRDFVLTLRNVGVVAHTGTQLLVPLSDVAASSRVDDKSEPVVIADDIRDADKPVDSSSAIEQTEAQL